MTEIAKGLNVTTATITGTVDGAEKHGLASRRTNRNDRRLRVVALSEKGMAFVDDIVAAALAHTPADTPKPFKSVSDPNAINQRVHWNAMMSRVDPSTPPTPTA